MLEVHQVKGYEQFAEFMKTFDSKGKIVNVLFSGEKDGKGVSWCIDCVQAEPAIKEALEKYGDNTILINVDVGDRAFWKDMNNPFRKDRDAHLPVIPVLMRWKQPQRLEGLQLQQPELLQIFFTDED